MYQLLDKVIRSRLNSIASFVMDVFDFPAKSCTQFGSARAYELTPILSVYICGSPHFLLLFYSRFFAHIFYSQFTPSFYSFFKSHSSSSIAPFFLTIYLHLFNKGKGKHHSVSLLTRFECKPLVIASSSEFLWNPSPDKLSNRIKQCLSFRAAISCARVFRVRAATN